MMHHGLLAPLFVSFKSIHCPSIFLHSYVGENNMSISAIQQYTME
jgi:hypothetical protein